MRIAFILQNLQAAKRRHGHAPRVGGKRINSQMAQMIWDLQRRQEQRQHAIALERMASARMAFERGLAEARQQQSLLKTSLYATLLAEV